MKKLLLLFSISLLTSGIFAQEAMIGEIRMFAGNFAPRGWALCDGQLLSISQNTALFSILGTTYGGDGRTTFALPDLRGRVPMHAGSGTNLTSRSLGQKTGSETNTLNITQIPSHTHSVTVTNPVYDDEANSDDPTGRYPAVSGENMYSDETNTNGATPEITIGNAGGSQPVNNMQPSLTINFIIATSGVFPSRN
ncbi:phage tail protein [Plebeiibacterium sediminum]|uniref:Tail fiber protein n=1 Tax=Plebeiibacterium sediminum TaxID=2992112 RepID=A0AAE3M448_9BACT|nr:tail fiber protein [Plebeiobacterium sediminum]MCW3786698.1 tail fiber protein [Plebeiobacterium sediminum]